MGSECTFLWGSSWLWHFSSGLLRLGHIACRLCCRQCAVLLGMLMEVLESYRSALFKRE
ncbi:hypothetical protein SERLADRAFT_474365 [Serpula lacrymans var. lacrymans S7.9]|uniref:Uncharacterized protein n=1 Tax=Serpula lacrymans var. lacrymans (strain S7.9) TaxID=578457 RepID=F8P4Y7_SERL9|nr:uncharacterized protein SERLADRAFT_474365 [Serpula lacrymans var. lacrymans S7.9]EGO21674.1 hypothetical protein SERLADRAFT_474365 [Serpula lacrymans var. lacrymans S7.9]